MEPSGPAVPATRPDKPHTFFSHEPAPCPTCADALEGRVVLRRDGVHRLLFCPRCGPSEATVAPDPAAYVDEFVARALAPLAAGEQRRLKQTTSTCPTCLRLLPAEVVRRGDQVFFVKRCESCGPSEALVSEDVAYYVRAYGFARAGTEPLHHAGEVSRGCPEDCGTCPDHEQHTCLPIVEVTDHCNLDCPICIVDNRKSSHMPVETFSRIVDGLVRAEGRCESVAISGGEPTTHPQLLELVDAATRDEIGRVVVITNGIRLARDPSFARELASRKAYVALQLDGLGAASSLRLRGQDLSGVKERALAALKEHRIPTQLIFVVARGVNEHELGPVVDLFLREDHLVSLNFQPLAHTGHGGGTFPVDPEDRLTIPGVLRAVEEQTKGRLRVSDFLPLPCSHPQCVSLTYLLRLEDGTHLPFARFVDMRRHGSLLRSSATLPASRETEEALQDIIHDVFANEDRVERGADVLRALRRSVGTLFPDRPVSEKEKVRIGEGQAKSIFVHAYMDPHDFDLERLRKCCHHYPQADGRIMPACGFNLFHRGAARGPDSPRAPWAGTPGLPVVR